MLALLVAPSAFADRAEIQAAVDAWLLCADLKNDDGSDFAVSGGFYTCARIEMHAPELCARTKGTEEGETLPSEMCCFCGGGAIA